MVLLATRLPTRSWAGWGGVHVQPVNNGRYAPALAFVINDGF